MTNANVYYLINPKGTAAILSAGAFGFLLIVTLYYVNKVNNQDISKQITINSSIKEKNILLTELHHRVKNNLQIIISLIQLKSYKIKDDAVKFNLIDVQSSIGSMALIHEKIYQNSGLYQISISEYIEDLINESRRIYCDYNVSFEFNLQELDLDLDTAIPLGLIINNIVNSMIISSSKNEEILIFFKLFEENENYNLIIWDKKGISLNNEYFDFEIFNALIQQIEGSYDIEKENGFKYTIKFKTHEINFRSPYDD